MVRPDRVALAGAAQGRVAQGRARGRWARRPERGPIAAGSGQGCIMFWEGLEAHIIFPVFARVFKV